MKKIKNYAFISVLVLTAFFMIAARSPEAPRASAGLSAVATGPQGVVAEAVTPGAAAAAEAPQAVKTTSADLSTAIVGHAEKLTLKEKLIVKIVQKKLQRDLKRIEAGKAVHGGKSQLVALLLCIFLGGIGIHRFYLGYIGIGIIQILTAGGCGIWVLIDLIRIITGDLGPKGGSYETTL